MASILKFNGVVYDIPDAERGFMRYTSDQRSMLRSSMRTGYRQREAVGEAYWTHPLVPDVCFPTRKLAREAALTALAAL